MRFGPWRHARASAVFCLAAALFTSVAVAQQQSLRPGASVSEANSEGKGAVTKTVADIQVWKRITIGTYKGVNAVRDALEAARVSIGDSADEILGRPAFQFSRTKTELDLVVLTAADLGFEHGHHTIAEIYGRAIQLGLQLCPAEVGPQLRLQYAKQPVSEFLHIAMEPIATYDGTLVDLTIGYDGDRLLLLAGDGSPDLKLHSTIKFVFVRPSHVASGDAEGQVALGGR